MAALCSVLVEEELWCDEVEEVEEVAGEEGWRGGRESFSLDETAMSAIVFVLGEERREKEEGGEMERGGERGEGKEECGGMMEGLI